MNIHDNMNEMRRLGVGPDRIWRFVRECNIKKHNRRVAECRARIEPRVVTRDLNQLLDECDKETTWKIVKNDQAVPADMLTKINELESHIRIQTQLIDQLRAERNNAYNDEKLLQGTIKATVAERDRALAAAKHWEAEKETAYSKLLKTEDELEAVGVRADILREQLVEKQKIMEIALATDKEHEAERDKALARVKELESDLVHVQSQKTVDLNDQAALEIEMAEAARDKALAEAAVAKHEVDSTLAKAEALHRDLAAMKERAEKAEADNRRLMNDGIVGGVDVISLAVAEADALRAEVEKLKARKVKLPHPRIGWDKSRTAETVVDWQQTIAAIRAAGVEVEAQRDSAVAERNEACKEADALRAEIAAAIGTDAYMDPPDGGEVSLPEQVRRMKADVDALIKDKERLMAELAGEQHLRKRSERELALVRSYPILSDTVVDSIYENALNQTIREQDRKTITAIVSDAWHRGAQHSIDARVKLDRLFDLVAQARKEAKANGYWHLAAFDTLDVFCATEGRAI